MGGRIPFHALSMIILILIIILTASAALADTDNQSIANTTINTSTNETQQPTIREVQKINTSAHNKAGDSTTISSSNKSRDFQSNRTTYIPIDELTREEGNYSISFRPIEPKSMTTDTNESWHQMFKLKNEQQTSRLVQVNISQHDRDLKRSFKNLTSTMLILDNDKKIATGPVFRIFMEPNISKELAIHYYLPPMKKNISFSESDNRWNFNLTVEPSHDTDSVNANISQEMPEANTITTKTEGVKIQPSEKENYITLQLSNFNPTNTIELIGLKKTDHITNPTSNMTISNEKITRNEFFKSITPSNIQTLPKDNIYSETTISSAKELDEKYVYVGIHPANSTMKAYVDLTYNISQLREIGNDVKEYIFKIRYCHITPTETFTCKDEAAQGDYAKRPISMYHPLKGNFVEQQNTSLNVSGENKTETYSFGIEEKISEYITRNSTITVRYPFEFKSDSPRGGYFLIDKASLHVRQSESQPERKSSILMSKPAEEDIVILSPSCKNCLDLDGRITINYTVNDPTITNCSLIVDDRIIETRQARPESIQTFTYDSSESERTEWSISCERQDDKNVHIETKASRMERLHATNFDIEGLKKGKEHPNAEKLNNITFRKGRIASITFNEDMNLTGSPDLDKLVTIKHNNVTIDTESESRLNRSATITFDNLTYEKRPIIRRNGNPCPKDVCTGEHYEKDNGTLTFIVKGFSSYTSDTNAQLRIWEEKENVEDSTDIFIDDTITFYANYTNSTSGESIDRAEATCNISIDLPGFSSTEMTYDTSKALYNHTITNPTSSNFNYSINCEDTGNPYEPLSLTDEVMVNQGGKLDVYFSKPTYQSTHKKGSLETYNTTITCIAGFCGNVSAGLDPIVQPGTYEITSFDDFDKGVFNGTTASSENFTDAIGLGYQNGTESDDLRIYYRMDQAITGSNDTVVDYSGNGRDGQTYNDETTSGEGVFSTGGFEFNATDYTIMTDDNDTSDIALTGDEFALMAWVRSADGFGKVVYKQNSYEFGLDENARPYLKVWNPDYDDISLSTWDDRIQDNNWHQVAAVFNSTHLKLYIDGEIKETSTSSGNLNTNTNQIQIGDFQGGIDEVQLYNRSLTTNEIEKLYLEGMDGTFSGKYKSELINVTKESIWNSVTIDADIPLETEVNMTFHVLDSNLQPIDSQIINILDGTNTYTLNIDNSNFSRLDISGSTTSENVSWIVNDISINYTETIIGKGLIPEGSGNPFYVDGSNPITETIEPCLENMQLGESCSINWSVNATGALSSKWLFFSFGESANCSMTESEKENITIVERNKPTITIHDPEDKEVFQQKDILFNWTATDDTAKNMSCNLIIDDIVTTTDINSPNATPTSQNIEGIAGGEHEWYLSCNDTYNNTKTTISRTFSIIGNASVDFINISPHFEHGKNHFVEYKANISCFNGECGNISTTISVANKVDADQQTATSDFSEGTFDKTSSQPIDFEGGLGIGHDISSINDSLRAYYRMDETITETGSTVKDSSGNGKNGMVQLTTVNSTKGIFSTKGFEFNTTDYPIIIDDENSSNYMISGDEFAIAAWVKSSEEFGKIISKENAYQFGVDNNGRPYLKIRNPDWDFTDWSRWDDRIQDSDWHQVAAAFNSTHMNLYIDGELKESTLSSGNLNTNDFQIEIGNFKGSIDELFIYNRSLTTNEMRALYFNGRNGIFSGNHTIPLIEKESEKNWTRLKVNATIQQTSSAEILFKAISSTGTVIDEQSISLNDGMNNYTITTDNSHNASILFNLTSTDPTTTPIIHSYTLFELSKESGALDDGSAFDINDTNPVNPTCYPCLEMMLAGDSCEVSWMLNATADYGSEWNIFAVTNSTFTHSSESERIMVTVVDWTPPHITLLGPADQSGDNDGDLTIGYRPSDLSGISNCTLIMNNQRMITNATIINETDTSFIIDGLESGTYEWQVDCFDTSGNEGSSAPRYFDVILTDGFSNDTTDFSTVTSTSSVEPLIIENEYGLIEYTQPVNLSGGANLTELITISNNLITVDTTRESRLNRTATILLRNVSYNYTPSIFKDGEPCADCILNTYQNNIVNASVQGFSEYTAEANSQLTIWDQSDPDNNAKAPYIGDSIIFYANYSNSTPEQPITGTGIECNIDFEDTDNTPATMFYNASSQLYEYNRTFDLVGEIGWNVTCNGTSQNYENQKETDSIYILPKVFVKIANITSIQDGNPAIAQKNKYFNATFNVSCADITCGDVNVSPILQPIISNGRFENGNLSGWTSQEMSVQREGTGYDLSKTEPVEGNYMAMSTTVDEHSTTAWMERSFNLTFPRELSFSIKVDSDASDNGYAIVDGMTILTANSNMDWQETTYELEEGEHTIRFEYEKDDSISANSDRMYVDNVTLSEPIGPISDQEGETPFTTKDTNTKSVYLNNAEWALLEFTINATGPLDLERKIGAHAYLQESPKFKMESESQSMLIQDLIPPEVELISPENNTISNNKSYEFSCEVKDDVGVSEVTFLLWNSSNSLVNTSMKDVNHLQKGVIDFNYTLPYNGSYSWNCKAKDHGNNTNTSATNHTLEFKLTDLAFSYEMNNKTGLVEDEDYVLTMNISNEGSVQTSGFNTTFRSYIYNGSYQPISTITERSGGLEPGEWTNISFNWISDIGPMKLFMSVDTNDEVFEVNETNNNISTNISIPGWTFYYGNYSHSFIITDSNQKSFYNWTESSIIGNMYFFDYDSDVQYNELSPFTTTSELDILDEKLNMSYFNDSIRQVFDSDNDGTIDSITTMQIAGEDVENIPYVNTYDDSTFITGILWDRGDGGSEYDGSQDVVIISKINQSGQGHHGTYDYEVKVPANLRSLKGTTDMLERYYEITE